MGNFFPFFCVNLGHNFEKSVFSSLESLKTPVIKPPVTVTEWQTRCVRKLRFSGNARRHHLHTGNALEEGCPLGPYTAGQNPLLCVFELDTVDDFENAKQLIPAELY